MMGDEGMTPIFNPMWASIFKKLGSEPVPENQCWGCCRGALGIESLPYQGLTALARDLPGKVVEHGMYGAARWAGEFYRTQVLANLKASPEVLAQCQWSGVSIVWHYFKHSNIAQFRVLGETLELQHAYNVIMDERLFVVPQFADPSSAFTIDRDELKALAPIRAMLDRQRKVDPKKVIGYHEMLGVSGQTAAVPFQTDRFTGRGLLHN